MKQLGKRFSLEFHAKSDIFSHFFRDANDWYLLYEHSQKIPITNLSIITKQFVLLRMAMECILKALVIGLSSRDESAKTAYGIAKSCSHRLGRATDESKKRSKKQYRICTKATSSRIAMIDALGIGIRYDSDMKTAYKRQTFAQWATGSGPVSGVVIDDDFHNEMKTDYFNFVKLAKRVCRKRLHGYNVRSGNRIEEVGEYVKRIVAGDKIDKTIPCK